MHDLSNFKLPAKGMHAHDQPSQPTHDNLLKKLLCTLAERHVPPRILSKTMKNFDKLSIHGHRQHQANAQIKQLKNVNVLSANCDTSKSCSQSSTCAMTITSPRTVNPRQPHPSHARESDNQFTNPSLTREIATSTTMYIACAHD